MSNQKDRGVYEKVPGSGVWWIRWQDERKKIRRKRIGQKSKAKIAVEQMRARVRLAVIAPELTAAPKRMTLKEAMQHVLETSTVSRRHKMYQHYYADRFNKEWPGALLADVTPASLETWMAKRRAQGVKPSTILHQLAFISKVFSVAQRNSWIGENPCAAIDRPADNARKTRFFSESEIDGILTYLNNNFGLMAGRIFALFVLTGLRRTELLSMERDQIDLELKIAVLPRTKGGGVQYVHLSDDAVEVFRQQLEAHPHPWIFPGSKGQGPLNPGNFYTRVYRPTLKALGIADATLHTTRHTHASHLALRGSTIQEIRDSLRQKSTAVAERYAHLNDTARRATAEKLSGLARNESNSLRDTVLSGLEESLTPALSPVPPETQRIP